MDKVIRDGKVAVIYSPGYDDVAWSTMYDDMEFCNMLIFDPDIVKKIEDNEKLDSQFIEHITGGYIPIPNELEVEWIDQGKKFTIESVDGWERIITCDDLPYVA